MAAQEQSKVQNNQQVAARGVSPCTIMERPCCREAPNLYPLLTIYFLCREATILKEMKRESAKTENLYPDRELGSWTRRRPMKRVSTNLAV